MEFFMKSLRAQHCHIISQSQFVLLKEMYGMVKGIPQETNELSDGVLGVSELSYMRSQSQRVFLKENNEV